MRSIPYMFLIFIAGLSLATFLTSETLADGAACAAPLGIVAD